MTENILFYGPNWVGDAVMSIPALRAIRTISPHATITVLTVPWVKAVYRVSGITDKILLYDRDGKHRGLRGTQKIIKEISEKRFTQAFILPNSWRSAIIAWAARIPQRAGLDTRNRGILLTHTLEPEKKFKEMHQMSYYLKVVQAAYGELRGGEETYTRPPLISLDSGLKASALSLARRLGIDTEKPRLAVAPGAQYGETKRWKPEMFAKIADILSDQYDAYTLVFGSPAEVKITTKVISLMKHVALNLAGKTTLLESIILLSQCKLLLTNDSGLMHVATSLGLPVVAVFGSTSPRFSRPIGLPERIRIVESSVECHPCFKRKCPLGTMLCMDSIDPEEVLQAGIELWTQS